MRIYCMIITILLCLAICVKAGAFMGNGESECLKLAKCYAYVELAGGDFGQAHLGTFSLDNNCLDPASRACAPWHCPTDHTTLDYWKNKCRRQFKDELEKIKNNPRVKTIRNILVGFPDIPFDK